MEESPDTETTFQKRVAGLHLPPSELDTVQEEPQKSPAARPGQMQRLFNAFFLIFLFFFGVNLQIEQSGLDCRQETAGGCTPPPRAAAGARKLEFKVERVATDGPYLEVDYSNPIIFTVSIQWT